MLAFAEDGLRPQLRRCILAVFRRGFVKKKKRKREEREREVLVTV